MVNEILIIFKTHLDLGFTDLASTIHEKYIKEYIPAALRVSKELEQQGDERFVWTMGSWMINEYLDNADADGVREMEAAIHDNRISWHALPFTTHTELMDMPLFEYGLGISKSLDSRFNKTTIAAKYTDVPGHTRGIIRPLSEAGVKFLHIGVNPACTPPDVPPLFRWRSPCGAEIVMMYQTDYGKFVQLGNTGKALYFAHTGDNHGPQSAKSIIQVYNELRKSHPGAKLTAATLNDVAEVVHSFREDLPVVTQEIGDSWIFGTGSDPRKMSIYRSLLRHRIKMGLSGCNKYLLPVPEHTWGLDEKTHLNDHGNFIRADFEAVRTQAHYLKMEQSWREQREYLTGALNMLPAQTAAAISAEYKKPAPDLTNYESVDPNGIFSCNGSTFSFNSHGAINQLEHSGTILADKHHTLCEFRYELFSAAEYERFQSQFITYHYDWALEDLGKIGIDSAISAYECPEITLKALYKKENTWLAVISAEPRVTQLFGCPAILTAEWRFEPDSIHVDFSWNKKPANRTAEAMWLGFNPIAENLILNKLGGDVNPHDMVLCGGNRLHAIQDGVEFSNLRITSLDTALVCPGEPSLLKFVREHPDLKKGVFFNLYNNIYGTNFPMWYDEDARFRFVISCK